MKLMAQLLMAGGVHGGVMSEQQRKEMMDNISKIIDKPVAPAQPSQANSGGSFVQNDSSKLKHSGSYSQSIKDSVKLDIIEESGLDKRSDIEEDIPDEAQSKELTSSDEIKESVHLGG